MVDQAPKHECYQCPCPQVSSSLLLPRQEALQDQQVGLTYAPFKLLLLPYILEHVRYMYALLRSGVSISHSLLALTKVSPGLPWWRSGCESACQCRAHGFVPWSGMIPHATEQLGPCATTTEPARLEPVLHNGRGRGSERPMHHDEEWPPLAATGGSPSTETKTQHSQK